MDLGANGFQTFRHVILPQIGTALLAGGMLAFALSFDEVIVTTFTAGQQSTLPIWMLSELIRPRQRPVTNVVAVFVIVVTLLPILVAYYLTREGEHIGRFIEIAGTPRDSGGKFMLDTEMLIGSKFVAGTEAPESRAQSQDRGDHRQAPRSLAGAGRRRGECRRQRPSRPGRAPRRPSARRFC